VPQVAAYDERMRESIKSLKNGAWFIEFDAMFRRLPGIFDIVLLKGKSTDGSLCHQKKRPGQGRGTAL
jgi:hypothetical protein